MKTPLLIVSLFLSLLAQAQQEIKVDLFDAIALKTVEVSYEYYLSNESSIGISALFNFEKETADFRYNENQMFTPYFRHYFSTNKKWNFFGEAFIGINSGKKQITIEGKEEQFISYTDGALGIAAGTKYISNSGFIVELYGGLGRNMFGNNSPAIVPRVGINLGYRFK